MSQWPEMIEHFWSIQWPKCMFLLFLFGKGFSLFSLVFTVVHVGEDDPKPWLVRRGGQHKPVSGQPVETGSDRWPPPLWCRHWQWFHFLLSQLPLQPPRKHHKGELVQGSQSPSTSMHSQHDVPLSFMHSFHIDKQRGRWSTSSS